MLHQNFSVLKDLSYIFFLGSLVINTVSCRLGINGVESDSSSKTQVVAAIATRFILSGSESAIAGACSTFTVTTVEDSNIATNVTDNTLINLGGGGSGLFYSDSLCANAITSMTIASGASSGIFFFKDNLVESLTLSTSGVLTASTLSVSILPGVASKLAVSTQPSNSIASTSFTNQPRITIQDAFGNTVTSATNTVTLAIGTNPGGGALSGTAVVTAVSGIAQFSGLSINKAGTGYTLTASASGLTGVTSAAFTIEADSVVVLSKMGDHSCALGSGGKLYCWGLNSSGQVGDNTTQVRGTPVQVISSGTSAVGVGDSHTCAIVDAALYCWGYNGNGAVGNNSTTMQKTPVQIIASGVTDINSDGEQFSCAIVSGALFCWGYNGNGNIGNGSTTNQLTPLQIISSGVTAVSIGYKHVCAIVGGALFCWGDNSLGQVGNGTTITQMTPTQVIASGVTAVSAGKLNTCAIVSGALFCWGYNGEGVVGNNSTSTQLTPTQVIASGVTSISTGYTHACAIVSAALQCWGMNSTGAVGNNSTVKQKVPVEVIAAGVTEVRTGNDTTGFNPFTCAVVSGVLKCWGSNVSGAVGNNSNTNQITPTEILASGSSKVSVGNQTACAFMGSAIRCWGKNDKGQVGVENPPATAAFLSPQSVSLP